MDYYFINSNDEDMRYKSNREKIKLAKKDGKIGSHDKRFLKKYKIFTDWFRKHYLNHGNIVAHLFGVVVDQMNKKGDREAFGKSSPDGRSLNEFMSRGLYFAQSIAKDYLPAVNAKKQLPGNMTAGYFVTGLMYIWDRIEIETSGLEYEYFGEDTILRSYKKHRDGPAYEWRIKNRQFMPAPKYILIGKTIRQLITENRIDIELIINFLKKKYPNVILIYTPHILFHCNKKPHETGNNRKSMNAQRLMEIIYNLEHDRYEHLKRKI